MEKCPMVKQDCTADCAWFINGDCYIAALPDLVQKLEDVVTGIYELERTVRNKEFQM